MYAASETHHTTQTLGVVFRNRKAKMLPKAHIQLVNKISKHIPAFTDVFDEQTFYITAAVFTLTTILVVIILSRFITLKPVN